MDGLDEISFTVPLIPTKRRVRFIKTGKTYTDARTESEMYAVKIAYLTKAKSAAFPHFKGAVSVEIRTHGKLPERTPKKVQSRKAVHKPDADNIAKAVLDALNGIAWRDDAQVTRLLAVKLDDTHLETPYTEITIKGRRK